MAETALLYGVTVAVFLALDLVALPRVMKPLFERHVGPLLRRPPAAGPAVAFYLLYLAGLVWLVSLPALRGASPATAALEGAVVGAMAFGTYEITNLATLKGWHWSMVAVDTAWGTALTALAAASGVWIAGFL
jgi:uncharacterized membrane protein